MTFKSNLCILITALAVCRHVLLKIVSVNVSIYKNSPFPNGSILKYCFIGYSIQSYVLCIVLPLNKGLEV